MKLRQALAVLVAAGPHGDPYGLDEHAIELPSSSRLRCELWYCWRRARTYDRLFDMRLCRKHYN